MTGLIELGLLWLLTSASGGGSTRKPAPVPEWPGRAHPPPSRLPAPPAPTAPPVTAPSGRSLALRPGATYRALIKLSGLQAFASNETVLARIQAAAGPWKNARASGKDTDRVVTGTYAGPARTIVLPDEVLSISAIGAPSRAPTPARDASPPAPTPVAVPPVPERATVPVRGRTPAQAAQQLYDYARKVLANKQGGLLGTKTRPNPFVRSAQADMGIAKPDGIYGPATRARGQQLLRKSFPARVSGEDRPLYIP